MNFRTFPLLVSVLLSITPSSSVLASPESKSTSGYAMAADTVHAYIGALRTQNSDRLEELLHPVWHHKFISDEISVIDKAQLQTCEGPAMECTLFPKLDFELTDLQINYGNFAIARLDARNDYSVSVVTLFKSEEGWRVANQATLDPALAMRAPHFSANISTQAVLIAMSDYYVAVESGQGKPLQSLFHPAWHMKNPDGDAIVAEGPAVFLHRADKRPLMGYYDNRYATDIQIVYERLAVVRVDNPETRSSTIFTFVRLDDAWQMIDKAWAIRSDQE